MTKNLREIVPLNEIKLSRIVGVLDSGKAVSTISPETEGMNRKQKKAAHKAMQGELKGESQKGRVSFTGPHAGRYKYAPDAPPSKEGSYLIRPGKNIEPRDFDQLIMKAAKKYNQQSILRLQKQGAGPAKGFYRYTDGKVEPKGDIHYNEPLDTGGGDTKLKGSGSFTVRKG